MKPLQSNGKKPTDKENNMSKLGRDGTAGSSTGGSRASGGISGSAGSNVNKINKSGSAKPIDAATKKRHAANEKSLTDALSRLLNGPWPKI